MTMIEKLHAQGCQHRDGKIYELLEVDLEHETAKISREGEEKIVSVTEVYKPEIVIVTQELIDEGGDYEALTIDTGYLVFYNL